MKRLFALFVLCSAVAAIARAQDHQHMAMGEAPPGWTFMQDGSLFLMVNHQGSDRGGTEVRAPNWWMGMAQRRVGRGTLRINFMVSFDPATVTTHGYREIFQAGETFGGNALIDRQHPHDFLMQAAAVYKRPVGHGSTLTIAGGPVGEPALGPVAYMHRDSAADNPSAPLGHHTLDSTHIAMGVITGGVAHGPVEIESSLFNAREPDEHRWDLFDPGALDSWSVRGWYRPTAALAAQVSYGDLTAPEALEEGNIQRTTASLSWHRGNGTAVTFAYGHNQKIGGGYNALLIEATHPLGRFTGYLRAERTQVETDVLRTGVHEFQGGRKTAHVTEPGRRDFVHAFTLGATRTLWRPLGWDLSAGGDLTGYLVPISLTPFYGTRPLSFHVFMHVRLPSSKRMSDMTMTR